MRNKLPSGYTITELNRMSISHHIIAKDKDGNEERITRLLQRRNGEIKGKTLRGGEWIEIIDAWRY